MQNQPAEFKLVPTTGAKSLLKPPKGLPPRAPQPRSRTNSFGVSVKGPRSPTATPPPQLPAFQQFQPQNDGKNLGIQHLSSSRGPIIDLGSLDRALNERIAEEQGEDGSGTKQGVTEFNDGEMPKKDGSPMLPEHLWDAAYRDKQEDGQGADSQNFDSEDDDAG